MISRPFFLRMRNVSDKRCSENQNTRFMTNFFSENRAVYEIIWKNTVQSDRPQMTGARALYDGYLRLQIHAQSMYYLLIFHYNNGCNNASQYYVIHKLPVLYLL